MGSRILHLENYIQLVKPTHHRNSERNSSGALYLSHVSAVLNSDQASQVQVFYDKVFPLKFSFRRGSAREILQNLWVAETLCELSCCSPLVIAEVNF